MLRRQILSCGILALLSACIPKTSSDQSESCPTTQPPEPPFSPPGTAETFEGLFWYGSPELWTALPLDGTWRELPRTEAGFTQKGAFWSENFDALSEPNPDLTLTGRRLDGPTISFVESEATHGFDRTGSFMLSGISIPTEGCWEFNADYSETSLSFVVEVKP